MNTEEFFEFELEVQNIIEEFKNQCHRQGFDFRDRIEDLIYNVENEY